jgi:hypothetical protein
MAQFTRVNGDLKPVLHLDAAAYDNAGVNAVTSAATVQPQGPKLDFFTITADGALTAGQVTEIVQVVQQLATVYIYEYTDAGDDTLAVALYPVGAYTTATLETAVNAITGIADVTSVTATATFTN